MFIAISISMEEAFQILPTIDPSEFYDKYMADFPMVVLEAEARNLILLEKRVVQKLNEPVNFLNTYIDHQVSRTASGVPNYTEVVVAWNSQLYLHVKEITIGSIFSIVKLLATTLLALERLLAFKNRLMRAASNN